MKILIDYPPNIDEIDAVFHVKARHGILYAWGDTICNPSNITIPPELLAHESVHGERQMHEACVNQYTSVLRWWYRYLSDPHFRLFEELLAHRAEYNFLCREGNRQVRRRALAQTAARLAGPLYGRLLNREKAARLLRMPDEKMKGRLR